MPSVTTLTTPIVTSSAAAERSEVKRVTTLPGSFDDEIIRAPADSEDVTIIARAADQCVVAAVASDDVVPAVAGQRVVARTADEILNAADSSCAESNAARQIHNHRCGVSRVIKCVRARAAAIVPFTDPPTAMLNVSASLPPLRFSISENVNVFVLTY